MVVNITLSALIFKHNAINILKRMERKIPYQFRTRQGHNAQPQ